MARLRRIHGETASDPAGGSVRIGGAQWTTLLDYPGRVAATLFLVGCDFRCPFCHNPELVDPARLAPGLDSREAIDRLRTRVGFLEAVVLSGGEPTIHPGLPALARELKALGLLVKLDTNGSRPDVLREVVDERLVDSIAMDVKAPLDDYDRLTGVACDRGAIDASIDLIFEGATEYEFRTTVAPTLTREDVVRIAGRLRGANRYTLQAFRVSKKGLLDPTWQTRTALTMDALEALWEEIRPLFADGGVRG